MDVASHGAGRLLAIACQEGFDNGEVLAGLFGQPVVIVARLIAFPGQVAEGAEEDLQPAEFLGQEGIAAGVGDQVVQPAIHRPRLFEESRRTALERHEPFQLGRQPVQGRQVDPAARGARRFTFERTPHVANLADFVS